MDDLEIGTAAPVTPLAPKPRATRKPAPVPAATDGTSALALGEPTVLEGTILEPDQLTTVEPDKRQEVFATPGGLRPILDCIATLVRAHKPNLTTDAGRKATASVAYQVAKCKTRLDDAGKALVDDLKALPKAIDANRKAMRDELDALRDEVRAPLTAWEEDQARQQAFVAGIDRIPGNLAGVAAAQVQTAIDDLIALDLSPAPDFATEAHDAKAVALDALCTLLKQRQKEEADAAELARLREQEAQRQREEAERRRQAEAKEREQQEATRREQEALEAKARAEQAQADAERRAQEAEQRADQEREQSQQREAQAREQAAAQERDRQVAAVKVQEAADAARAADVEHRRAFNQEALADLLKVLAGDEAAAKAVLGAIYKNQVRHIQIHY